MSTSPSNLKLALDAYDAQQRRQAALVEAERIGTLIHIQEQQLLAAKYLAKQRKSQRRRASANDSNSVNDNDSQATGEYTYTSGECAVEDEEDDMVFEPVLPGESESVCLPVHWCVDAESVPTTATPICPSLAARRAARSASKRVSHSLLESIPEPDAEPSDANLVSLSYDDNNDIIPTRWATHKRRPQEPFASLASRSQWKVGTNSRFNFPLANSWQLLMHNLNPLQFISFSLSSDSFFHPSHDFFPVACFFLIIPDTDFLLFHPNPTRTARLQRACLR
jgi:hypothetical protein